MKLNVFDRNGNYMGEHNIQGGNPHLHLYVNGVVVVNRKAYVIKHIGPQALEEMNVIVEWPK